MGDREVVTVIVPAHDEAGFLSACLASIRAQDYPDLQIVVIDSASTDSTPDIVRRHRDEDERVELVQVDRTGIPVALNRGLARARGRWLVRVDAHSTVPETYVRTAVTRLREGRWGGVGGRKDGVGRTPAGRAVAVAMSSRLGGRELDLPLRHPRAGGRPPTLRRLPGGARARARRVGREPGRQRGLRVRLPAPRHGRSAAVRPGPGHLTGTVGSRSRPCSGSTGGTAAARSTWPCCIPGRWGPGTSLLPLFVAYLAAALALAPRRPVLAQALLAPYAVAVVGESVRLAPRLHRRTEAGAHPRGDHGDARRLGPRVLVRRRTSGTVLGLRCFPSGVTRKYPASGLTSGLGGRREYERG